MCVGLVINTNCTEMHGQQNIKSPGLSACECCLWGSLKDNVYVNNPRAFNELKQNIRDKISAILLEVTRRIMNLHSTVH